MEISDLNEILNHCRIHQFLNKGREKLHEIFRNRWLIYKNLKNPGAINNHWSDDAICGAELQLLCSYVPSKQIEDNIKTGNIDIWDVTATNVAIQGVSKAIISFGVLTNKLEDEWIKDLKEIRNFFIHGNPKLSDIEYSNYCDQLTDILIKAGDKSSDIEAFKNGLIELGQPKIPKVVDLTSKFAKLKEEGNKLFKDNKFNEAIKIYNQILNIHDISIENQALIYSNRSAAYLMLKTQTSLAMAKKDAEMAIQLWPCWWRGYLRLGKTHIEEEKWYEAEGSLNKALALKIESEEARHELSVVRNKIGIISRKDHLNPGMQPQSHDEVAKESCDHLGISKKQLKDLHRFISKTPAVNIIKGHQYRDGESVPQDYIMAAKFYAKAAAHGIPEGMYNLAKLYHDGKGVKCDYKESVYWLKKAANADPPRFIIGSGVPEAQHTLGLIYSEGTGVTKDYIEAAKWYEKAMMNGNGGSANNLGILYQHGQGVEKSAVKAFNHFKMAVQLGDTPGMSNLADCYFYAEGTGSLYPTEEDIAEGLKWLRIAATKGDLLAAKKLEERENFSYKDHSLEAAKKHIYLSNIQNVGNPNAIDQEQYGKYVKEAAKNGSWTAQRHVKIWDNMNAAMEAFKKNDPVEVCRCLAKAIRLDHQIVKIPQLLHSTIVERVEAKIIDREITTCFVRLNVKNPRLKEIVELYLGLYPEDEFLLEMRVACFIDSEESDEALKLLKIILVFYPTSMRFLYLHGVVLSLQKKQTIETVKAYDAFLAIAPSDHDKVPASHYRKAEYFICKNQKQKFIECFEAGIESERKQLPCFLSYEFPGKNLLEKIYFMYEKELKEITERKKSDKTTGKL